MDMKFNNINKNMIIYISQSVIYNQSSVIVNKF